MATGKVTKRTVDELASLNAESFLWDQELKGFGVKVTRTGKRSYVFQYRLGGRESGTRRYSIGQHGSPWTPTTARREAERLAILVAQGIDPAADDAARRRENVDLAFDAYSANFQSSCTGVGWRNLVERTLRLHVASTFKRRSVKSITRQDIAAVLDRIPEQQLALKRNTFAVLRRLFMWAVARGDIDRSPCEGMEPPRAVQARDRVLSDHELTRIWQASFKIHAQFGAIVRLLMLTGQRREEVTGLVWEELDQTEAAWTLAKERSKNAVAHVVPLCRLAMQTLSEKAGSAAWPRKGAVFTTSSGGRFTAHARGKKQLDEIVTDIQPWRLHDLRRTMATGFQRLGVRFEVTEAALNHVSASQRGVAGVYQRHTWTVEKREAFDQWQAHLEQLFEALGASAPSS